MAGDTRSSTPFLLTTLSANRCLVSRLLAGPFLAVEALAAVAFGSSAAGEHPRRPVWCVQLNLRGLCCGLNDVCWPKEAAMP